MQLESLLYVQKLVSFYPNDGTKKARNHDHTRWSTRTQAENEKQLQDDNILQSFLLLMIIETFGAICIPQIAQNLSEWTLCFGKYTAKMA